SANPLLFNVTTLPVAGSIVYEIKLIRIDSTETNIFGNLKYWPTNNWSLAWAYLTKKFFTLFVGFLNYKINGVAFSTFCNLTSYILKVKLVILV
ncbi:hypothetical protein, partial [Lysinibacillus sp. JK80]|uniref:hypothetical protein n=1 Tax=Lysinibacillus sp. JK80 TaxID=2749809 RepID=UPI0022B9A9D7